LKQVKGGMGRLRIDLWSIGEMANLGIIKFFLKINCKYCRILRFSSFSNIHLESLGNLGRSRALSFIQV
jgi:hypothetical protein